MIISIGAVIIVQLWISSPPAGVSIINGHKTLTPIYAAAVLVTESYICLEAPIILTCKMVMGNILLTTGKWLVCM